MNYRILLSAIIMVAIFSQKSILAQTFNQTFKGIPTPAIIPPGNENAIAISSNYMIVGHPYDDTDQVGQNQTPAAGSAYLYERDGSGHWHQTQKIVASDRASLDWFGHSVSISGDYAVVATPFEAEDELGLNSKSNAGSVYIFKRGVTGLWSQAQKIVASDRAASDYFGISVSISGDRLVIGAVYESHDASGMNTLSAAGSAYIFERNLSGTWMEVQKIVASDRAANDRFGSAVAISGDYLTVGAAAEDHDEFGLNSLSEAGSAYVFERNGVGVWAEVSKIVASDRATGDRFGSTISISGNYILVGSENHELDALGNNPLAAAGAAYIFERNGGAAWVQSQKIVASDRAALDRFATSVSISGSYAVVGAQYESEDAVGLNTLYDAGSAYVFEGDTNGVWTEREKIVAVDREYDALFGQSTSIDGNYVAVSAPAEVNNCTLDSTAAVYVFELAGTNPHSNECLILNSSDTTICGGDSILLFGAYVLSAGLYSDTIHDGTGYDSIITSVTLSISAYSDTMGVSICSGDSIYVGGGWQTASGLYPDSYTSAEGCDSTIYTNLIVGTCLTMAERLHEVKIEVYPNPSNGQFAVLISSPNPAATSIKVFNLVGEIVREIGTISWSSHQDISVNLHDQPNGIYLMAVQSGHQQITQKLIIQR